MRDVLRLINRHGGNIWLFSSLGEGFLAILWMVGLFAVWLIANPSSEMIHKIFNAVYFPDHPEKLLDQIRTKILEFSPKVIALFVIMAVFFVLSILFSKMGMMGIIRQAVVEDRLSIGDFFSFGFRYLFPGFGLFLILSGTALLISWLFLGLDSLLNSGVGYRVALWGMGGIAGLYVLAYISFTPVVMLVEQTGVFRTLGRVFRLLWKWPVRTIYILLVAVTTAVLGVVLLGLISSFPWLILQFFPNETIAAIVGSFFVLLMIFIFHAFPLTLYMGNMILGYVGMRERLDPKKRDRKGEPHSSHSRVVWSRV